MSSAGNLKKDADELIRLSELTESVNVKRILTTEASKLKQLAIDEEKASAHASQQKVVRKTIRTDICTARIVNYGWDQSDKFLKIYVSISGAHTFPAENITCDFSKRSFELQIMITEKKTNNVLAIKNLLHDIIPAESYFKVKTDMVVVFLKKSSSDHWGYVTEAEKKSKEPKTPKLDTKEEDPNASLMTLMKQMYDDGDDDMKRTIAKAWTEARDKKSPDDIM